MRSLPWILLASFAPSCILAQNTEAGIKARLLDAPLYLSGQWSGDKLAFDAAGHLKGGSTAASFTLAGIDIKSITLTPAELVLNGQRVGLEFDKDVPQRVGLVLRGRLGKTKPEEMTVKIDAPADGDFKVPLDAIFTGKLSDLVPQLPQFWQFYAQKHLVPQAASAAPAGGAGPGTGGTSQPPGTAKLARVGGGVAPPRLARKVDPDFSEAARAMKYSGISLVNLIVDADGKPSHVRILRPAGLGLDEQAVAAVSRYTFKPAMENGSPVAVELNVEVNFQIF